LREVEPGEVILAEWDVSNYLAPRMRGSVFGGHPVATLQPNEKRHLMTIFFTQRGDLDLARRLGAQWVVYGPGAQEPALPAAAAAFQYGNVRVYRVEDDL
jgi:hypothetical protein